MSDSETGPPDMDVLVDALRKDAASLDARQAVMDAAKPQIERLYKANAEKTTPRLIRDLLETCDDGAWALEDWAAAMADYAEPGRAEEVLRDSYGAPPPAPVSAKDAPTDPPARVLARDGEDGKAAAGPLLARGGVAVLAGRGGIGKSALTARMALGLASGQDGAWREIMDGLLWGECCPAIMATWEDHPAYTANRLRAMTSGIGVNALERVHLLDMTGHPVFGPGERQGGASGLYNARPEPLPAWHTLWRAVETTKAKLLIIDPATAAFAGDSHRVESVREFIGALHLECARRDVAALLVAHSTKDAKKQGAALPDPFDPGVLAGSAAWVDALRCVLTLTDGFEPGERLFAIAKANHTKSPMVADVEFVEPEGGGSPVDVRRQGAWMDLADWNRRKAEVQDQRDAEKEERTKARRAKAKPAPKPADDDVDMGEIT